MAYKREVYLATKPGLTHYILYKKIPVPNQENDSCKQFI